MLGNGTNFVYSLDHFIWTRLRVWLIKKYPTTSRRLLYKNFFGTQICKKEAEKIRKEYSTKGFSFLTDNSKFIDISPVRLKWHFRSKIESESHRSNIRWLDIGSKLVNPVPMELVILKTIYKELNFYCHRDEYEKNKLYIRDLRHIRKILGARTRNLDNFTALYNKQKGKCEYCNQYLELPDNCIPTDYIDNHTLADHNLAIHHVKPLALGGSHKLSNLSLLHQECHQNLHRGAGIEQDKLHLPHRVPKR